MSSPVEKTLHRDAKQRIRLELKVMLKDYFKATRKPIRPCPVLYARISP